MKQTISGFELIEHQIGIGGQARIYRCRRVQGDNRTYAIKIIKRSKDDKAMARLRNEIAACQTLDHPNILKILEANTEGSDPYALYPYYPAGDLARNIASLKFQSPNLLSTFIELAEALDYAHRHSQGPFFHRDIKPANILCDKRNRRLIIADWGLVKNPKLPAVTSIDERVGPRYFMAPELDDPNSPDAFEPSCDVYSLGKLYFFILSQGLIIPRENLWAEDVRSAFESKDSIHNGLYNLLQGMIAVRSTRISSMQEVLRRLKVLRDLLVAPAQGVTPDPFLDKLTQYALKGREEDAKLQERQQRFDALLARSESALNSIAQQIDNILETKKTKYSAIQEFVFEYTILDSKEDFPNFSRKPEGGTLVFARAFHFRIIPQVGHKLFPKDLVFMLYVDNVHEYRSHPEQPFDSEGSLSLNAYLIFESMHPKNSFLLKNAGTSIRQIRNTLTVPLEKSAPPLVSFIDSFFQNALR